MQRKYIFVGETWLQVKFDGNKVDGDSDGGALLRLAAEVARRGHKSLFISEIGIDKVGDKIAADLVSAGVDISCADRYAGATTLALEVDGRIATRYTGTHDGERFDIAWPRVEKEDVVIFGGYMAVDEGVRERLWSFLDHVAERKATIVYIPALDDPRLTRITLVMPRVFENLEIADAVISLPADLQRIYGHDDAAKAYRDNISFYCRDFAAVTDAKPLLFGELAETAPVNRAADDVATAADIIMSLPLKQ